MKKQLTIAILVFSIFLFTEYSAKADDNASANSESKEISLLEVNTDPVGASVSMGGTSPEFQQTLGTTPLKTEIQPGPLTLHIELEGYQTAVAAVEAVAGQNTLVQIKLEKETVSSRDSLRIAGHLLFWPGILTAGTGAILIAVDNESRNTGMSGFITAGIGTAMVIAGGLILGLTHRDKTPYTMPVVSFTGSSQNPGAAVSIVRSF